jgi:hypothetical protein
VLGVRLEFQTTGMVETIHGLDHSDYSSAEQIVECDTSWRPEPEALRDIADEADALKDCSLSAGAATFHGC